MGSFVPLVNSLLVDFALDGFLVSNALAADFVGPPTTKSGVLANSNQTLFADSVISAEAVRLGTN